MRRFICPIFFVLLTLSSSHVWAEEIPTSDDVINTESDSADTSESGEASSVTAKPVPEPALSPIAEIEVRRALAASIQKAGEEADSLRRGQYFRGILASPSPFEFRVGLTEEPITEREFYERIARPDLVIEMDRLSSKQAAMGIGFGVGGALGLGLTFVGLLGGALDGHTPALIMALTGGGLLGTGIGGVIYAVSMNTHPISHAESVKLMQIFNEKEANKAGISLQVEMD